MILSAAMLLEWLGGRHDDERLVRAAALMRTAVEDTVAAGTATGDLGGSASTSGFAQAVAHAIDASAADATVRG